MNREMVPQAVGKPLFEETQTFHRVWWVMALVLGIGVLQWWFFYEQIIQGRPAGDNPAPDWMLILFWLLFGIGLPLFFWWMHLRVTVDDTAVTIQFRPLTTRIVPIGEIQEAEAGRYSPLTDFGGWGIRGFGSRRAYSVHGNEGVTIRLTAGDQIIIGSQRPRELVWAINAAIGAAPHDQ